MKTILVIDDDSQMCGILCNALQVKGYRAIGVENAERGIQLAREHNPCIIVSDIFMPDGDGYQVISSLSDNEITASIPVILMTGQPDAAATKQEMDLGAADLLIKPFTAETLFASVETSFLKRESRPRVCSINDSSPQTSP